MKMMWCWRCQKDVPVLDEQEHDYIRSLYPRGRRSRTTRSLMPLSKWWTRFERVRWFRPLRETYRRMTGVDIGDRRYGICKHLLAPTEN